MKGSTAVYICLKLLNLGDPKITNPNKNYWVSTTASLLLKVL